MYLDPGIKDLKDGMKQTDQDKIDEVLKCFQNNADQGPKTSLREVRDIAKNAEHKSRSQ